MKTLFGASVVAARAAGAGDGAGAGTPNVKGVPFDGAAGFAGSVAGGCSDGRLRGGARIDSTGFAGGPNVRSGAGDGVAVVGFSASFGNVGAAKVEGAAVESGGVANMDIGREDAPNGDGVASAAFGTCGPGTSAGFDCSTAGGVRNGDGVVIVAACARTEELQKKFGIPDGAALEVGATVAGRVRASGASFTASGVGGTSAILGRAGAGVVRTGIGAVGGAGVGLVRENGSEITGGSFARVKSCVIVVYEV